jgi:hypothetical protein
MPGDDCFLHFFIPRVQKKVWRKAKMQAKSDDNLLEVYFEKKATRKNKKVTKFYVQSGSS